MAKEFQISISTGELLGQRVHVLCTLTVLVLSLMTLIGVSRSSINSSIVLATAIIVIVMCVGFMLAMIKNASKSGGSRYSWFYTCALIAFNGYLIQVSQDIQTQTDVNAINRSMTWIAGVMIINALFMAFELQHVPLYKSAAEIDTLK